MAPPPKAPGQRRRRNVGLSQWRQLPAAGGSIGKVPSLPRRDNGWLVSTRAWWKRAWGSPMASAWLDSDFDSMLRLASMRDDVFRYPDRVGLHAAITALEDRLGLSPKSRRLLQWEVSQVAAESDRSGSPAPVRRLRAVG